MTSKSSVEARGATIDEAIAAGLTQLGGARRTDVKIEVLDEGSRGVLGIGKRDAVLRLTLLDRLPADAAPPASSAPAAPEPATPPARAEQRPAPAAKPAREKPAPPRIERQPAPTRETRPAAPPPEPAQRSEPKPEPGPQLRPRPQRPQPQQPPQEPPERPRRSAPPPAADDEPMSEEALALEAETARDVVTELLELLGLSVAVDVTVAEPDDRGQRVPVVDVSGRDSQKLLGARGRTLNALQFLTRAMVAQQLHTRAHFIIDVAGYREERNEQIEAMAREMAEQAVRYGRPIALKPMPAYERRIVHMTLREDKRVTTRSKGEGERRRVRIIPTQAGASRPDAGSGNRRRPRRRSDNRQTRE